MTGETLRLDKWLWFARFYKSRSLAARHCESGVVYLNGQAVTRPAQSVRQGDLIDFPAGPKRRAVRVLALGERRGPAPEARTLYEDLPPPPPRPED